MNMNHGHTGLLKGGGFYSLGVQVLTCVVVIVWTSLSSYILLQVS